MKNQATDGKKLNSFKKDWSQQDFETFKKIEQATGLYTKLFESGGEAGIKTYQTLTWETKKEAQKNEKEIKEHFGTRFLKSEILHGKDERGNVGFYVSYVLKKEQFSKGGIITTLEGFKNKNGAEHRPF